jgi:2Fe-2S ferredoxin
MEVASGTSICDALLDHGVEIEHACGKVGACTTCHVIVKQGFDSLNPMDDNEEDMLDQAWGLQPHSRLSCQARLGAQDVVVEIPKYSINHAKENA